MFTQGNSEDAPIPILARGGAWLERTRIPDRERGCENGLSENVLLLFTMRPGRGHRRHHHGMMDGQHCPFVAGQHRLSRYDHVAFAGAFNQKYTTRNPKKKKKKRQRRSRLPPRSSSSSESVLESLWRDDFLDFFFLSFFDFFS